jgi:hypothetical protein
MRKTQIIKKNIYEWYEADKFENTIQYAIKCSNLAGVDKYLSELQRKYQDYRREMDVLIKRESSLLDNSFHVWDIAEKIKSICKWGSISSFILFFINVFVRFSDALTIITCLCTVFGCIAAIILKIASVVLNFKYNAYYKSVGDKATAINVKYIKDLPVLWNKIDDLYLASLEPTHREAVLMRRDQERHHQEKMRAQIQHQQIVEQEQRRTRKAQEEILQIERDREERYWKNRY